MLTYWSGFLLMYICLMTRSERQELIDKGLLLPLMEEFYTIQGEGYHKGTAAYFVRIGGCDVGCHWCDVKESWLAELHPPTEASKIVENAAKYSNTIVVTGGEPLTWNMTPLTEQLKAKGLQTHIETSGAYPLTGMWDWICLSPKKTKLPYDLSVVETRLLGGWENNYEIILLEAQNAYAFYWFQEHIGIKLHIFLTIFLRAI